MRKAAKREQGRQKQEENLRKSQATGLQAQQADQERREKDLQKALIARDTRQANWVAPPLSQKAKDKQDRVRKRLAEKNDVQVLEELESQPAQEINPVAESYEVVRALMAVSQAPFHE
jgi:hypothetical protein